MDIRFINNLDIFGFLVSARDYEMGHNDSMGGILSGIKKFGYSGHCGPVFKNSLN